MADLLKLLLAASLFHSASAIRRGAEACREPMDMGPCQQFEHRWYWDQQRKLCRSFYYGGCLGNDNNFLSKKECLRHCVYKPHSLVIPDLCMLSRDPGYCNDDRVGLYWWYFDAEKGQCVRFYHYGCGGNHNKFSTKRHCQQVCAEKLSPETVQCGKCDVRKSTCKMISKYNYTCQCRDGFEKDSFGVCQGKTTVDCSKCHKDATCIKGVCQCKIGFKGDGLLCKDVDECQLADFPCAPEGSCENTIGSFRCTCPEDMAGNGYSCTKSTRSCLDKFDREYKEECGEGNWEEKYFFEHGTKRCQLFWYDGCNGTSRNFFSELSTCERMCERSKVLHRAQVCWDAFDKHYTDQCGAKHWTPRYYFDPETMSCTQFWYASCKGTSRNIFPDLISCQWQCEIQPMYLSRACLEPFDQQYKDQCGGGQWKLRYYYDNTQQRCVGFWYDSCKAKSQNLFPDQRTCQYLCQDPAHKAAVRETQHRIRHSQKQMRIKELQWKKLPNDTYTEWFNSSVRALPKEEMACIPNPCKNGGTCKGEGNGKYHCNCAPGFQGKNCGVRQKNPCNLRPCKNGGTCNPTVGMSTYWCKCPNRFVGIHCEAEVTVDRPTTTMSPEDIAEIERKNKEMEEKKKKAAEERRN